MPPLQFRVSVRDACQDSPVRSYVNTTSTVSARTRPFVVRVQSRLKTETCSFDSSGKSAGERTNITMRSVEADCTQDPLFRLNRFVQMPNRATLHHFSKIQR